MALTPFAVRSLDVASDQQIDFQAGKAYFVSSAFALGADRSMHAAR